jgi:hypothetical protein
MMPVPARLKRVFQAGLDAPRLLQKNACAPPKRAERPPASSAIGVVQNMIRDVPQVELARQAVTPGWQYEPDDAMREVGDSACFVVADEPQPSPRSNVTSARA